MPNQARFAAATLAGVLSGALLPAAGQDQSFRVATELVQTDVLVFDRDGKFVDDIPRDQFQVSVDGTPQTIAWFERVQAGSVAEERQLAAARGVKAPLEAQLPEGGRTLLFFVDDFHLGMSGLTRARQILTEYIDQRMGPHDQVAIVTPSGQLGFLQQLTSSKTMLRAAVSRLSVRARAVIDLDRPAMTIHQAQLIDNGRDRDIFEFFVTATLRQNPIMKRPEAEAIVSGRASQIVLQSTVQARTALLTLAALVRSNGELPGRKLVLFITDGFEVDPTWTEAQNVLRDIGNESARYRFVIYTMDSRGLATQPSYDASRDTVFPSATRADDHVFDPEALERANADELFVSQGPLFQLAAETGGRMFANSNAFDTFLPRALQETSRYYVLAWYPELANDARRGDRPHRVEVSIKDRPELRLRFRRSYIDAPAIAARAANPASPPSRRRPQQQTEERMIEEALLSALRATPPVRSLPVSVSLGFMDLPSTGVVVTSAVQFDARSLGLDADRTSAVVDLASAVFDDAGKGISSYKNRITLMSAPNNRVRFARRFPLKPGLYQVRVAARDVKTGLVGSASEWIDIPKMQGGAFAMSSLIVQRAQDDQSAAAPDMSDEHRVPRQSRLRVLAYVYNATRGPSAPDVSMSIQLLRDDKAVISTRPSRLNTNGSPDLARIPYLAEINLEGMPSGAYVIQVSAVDRPTQATAVQRLNLEIE